MQSLPIHRVRTGLAIVLLCGTMAASRAQADNIFAWGIHSPGLVNDRPTGTNFKAIAGGGYNGYALRADGSIAAWGSDFSTQVRHAPTGTGFTAIAGGNLDGYALKATIAPVPEAGTVITLAIGLVDVGGLLRCRRRA